MNAAEELQERFRAVVRRAWDPTHGNSIVVAVSGGVDSDVLLHLLRFTAGLPELRLVVAHVDHAMRPDSAEDAEWVCGLAQAWGLPCRSARLAPPPATEEEARRARYAFLRDVHAREGAAVVVTAHHADDQAETVLFRVLRGTGVRGLTGIPERRGPFWRPLLSFRRHELEAYARAVGLTWRDDPSNRDVHIARNALRRSVLPAIEAGPAPYARHALTELARRARQEEAAWQSLVPSLLASLDVQRERARISFAREGFLRYHPAVRARLLRALARELASPLKEAGTEAAHEFTSHGRSGHARDLSGTLRLGREFGRLVLAQKGPVGADLEVVIRGAVAGNGRLRVGGRSFTVIWGSEPPSAGWREFFSLGEMHFPVAVRGWAPGDRVRLAYGTKKLKKLFLEARIPASERRRVPVVVDASGDVVWVPGVARSWPTRMVSGEEAFGIGIADADAD